MTRSKSVSLVWAMVAACHAAACATDSDDHEPAYYLRDAGTGGAHSPPFAGGGGTGESKVSPTPAASPLAGRWTGQLSVNGTNKAASFEFSDAGNFVFHFPQSGQVRSVELTYEGQMVEFVPLGGGVTKITVGQLERSNDRLYIAWAGTFDAVSGELLDQQRFTSECDFTLVSFRLRCTCRDQTVNSERQPFQLG